MNTDTLYKMKRMHLLWVCTQAFKMSLETPSTTLFTTDELVAMLIDSEWDDRHNRTIERTVRNARFRYKATIEALDYSLERGLDKNIVYRLADAAFIGKKEDLLITGPTGTGKSSLASALGYQACGLWALKYFILTPCGCLRS